MFLPFLTFLVSIASLGGWTADPDWEEIAEALVERMALSPDERVLLIAETGRFDPLVPSLRDAIVRTGAEDLGALSVSADQPAAWETSFTRKLQGKEPAEMVERLSAVDLAVMLPGASPLHPPYAAMQEVLRSGRGRAIHFHWSGAYGFDGWPLPIDAEMDALYERALLETDYAALSATQSRFEAAMRDAETRVTTELGTDLRFRIGDRPVTLQDGDASAGRANRARNLIDREKELPAGAVRVAPIEESVNGRIAFPPGFWGGGVRVVGLVLTIERGRVVRIEASSGHGAVETELSSAGEAGRSFREFALGFNPLLAIPPGTDPPIPYYGYGAGVVRLSLGDNSELGGKVTGGYVRWNFFPDATVTVGDKVWVRDGRLRQPDSGAGRQGGR